MAGSRANWEDQTGEKKLSSFERSKRDIADNVQKVKQEATKTPNRQSRESELVHLSGGLVNKAIKDILSSKKRTEKYLEE
jgi:hypothetical protein